MVYKYCPKCDLKVPIATKSCTCSYIFFGKKLMSLRQEKENKKDVRESKSLKLKRKTKTKGPTLIRRRTERLSRGKPAFYSASEFENYPVRFRRLSSSSQERSGKRKHKRDKGSPKKKMGRPKGSFTKKKDVPEEHKEEDVYANITPEKAFLYAFNLAEINRKFRHSWTGYLPLRNNDVSTGSQTATTEVPAATDPLCTPCLPENPGVAKDIFSSSFTSVAATDTTPETSAGVELTAEETQGVEHVAVST